MVPKFTDIPQHRSLDSSIGLTSKAYSNTRKLICSVFSVRIAGGVGGVEPPYLTLPTPLPLVKIRPRGGRVSTPPHLSFAEVGMLLDSHFLLTQFLKYLGVHHDDLNVTTSCSSVAKDTKLPKLCKQ